MQVKVALGRHGGDQLLCRYSDCTIILADKGSQVSIPAHVARAVAGATFLVPVGVSGRNRLASLRGGLFYQGIFLGTCLGSRLRRGLLKEDAAN